ncbi:MAG: type II toxin-antitoxin system VapC family toxin [Pseudonocardiales bacterium]|nr:type II toxin-antitoxin system VapC family toxin [Pseudonocardiales bacterium]
MRTLLLDTHVLQWWSAEPERLSDAATDAIAGADELAVAAISWYELAWLAAHERIVLTIPIASWLARLAAGVRTVGITPAIAHTAIALSSTFLGDPADRLIYATAVECGWSLVSKDRRLREHPYPREITIW